MLRHEIQKRNSNVGWYHGDKVPEIASHALKHLKSAIESNPGVDPNPNSLILKPNTKLGVQSFVHLGIYRNQILQVFFVEGIIAMAIQVNRDNLEKKKVMEDIKFLIDLVSKEFLSSPIQEFEKTYDEMESKGMFDPKYSKMHPHDITLEFLCELFYCFVEGYWVICIAFFSFLPSFNPNLTPDFTKMDFEDLSLLSCKLSEHLLERNIIYYHENFTVESLRNSLLVFQSWKLITQITVNLRKSKLSLKAPKTATLVELLPEYRENNGQELWKLSETIGRFRKVKRDINFGLADITLLFKNCTFFKVQRTKETLAKANL